MRLIEAASIALSFERTSFGPVLFGGDIERGLGVVSRLGFSRVELSVRDPQAIDRQWLRRLLDENRLAVSGIATGQAHYTDGLSLVDLDPKRRSMCLDRLKAQIDLAAELGAQVIIGGIRGVLSMDPAERKKQEAAFLAGLHGVSEYGHRVGVSLALEPINRYETNLVNTVRDGLEVLRQVNAPNMGLLVDTFHMNIEEPDICGSVRTAGEKMCYVHVADSNRWAPGCGHTDFCKVLSTLDEIQFGGPISAEVLPRPTDEEAARAVARFWSTRKSEGVG